MLQSYVYIDNLLWESLKSRRRLKGDKKAVKIDDFDGLFYFINTKAPTFMSVTDEVCHSQTVRTYFRQNKSLP